MLPEVLKNHLIRGRGVSCKGWEAKVSLKKKRRLEKGEKS
jgi:hypothetical protein